MPAKATPHHQGSSPKLQLPFNQPVTEALSWLFSCPFPPIWSNPVYFSLIWPDHPLPILNSPVIMGMSKFQVLLSVLLSKKRTFPLYNSLKIVLFECPSDSLRVGWLGNDGIYELGCLDCIINMFRGDLVGNRVLVGFRELSWMTPFAVFLVKFNFLGNPINSTPAKTSFGGNFTMGIVGKVLWHILPRPKSDILLLRIIPCYSYSSLYTSVSLN